MSLGVTIACAATDARSGRMRLFAPASALLLVGAAVEQSDPYRAALYALLAAIVLLAVFRKATGAGDSGFQLRILPDGSAQVAEPREDPGRLAEPASAVSVYTGAEIVIARRFAGVVFLRLRRPRRDALGSARVAHGTAAPDRRQWQHCEGVVRRSQIDPAAWAGLGRWLVWRRRMRSGARRFDVAVPGRPGEPS